MPIHTFFKKKMVQMELAKYNIYQLLSEIEVNSGRIFTDMQSMEVNILKPLFTEIKENNCISIYKLGDNTFTNSKQEFSV